MVLNGFSVLLCEPITPEVLAEIKRTIYTAFCPFILRLKLLHNAFEIRFTMTWILQYIMFQIREGNELTGQKS